MMSAQTSELSYTTRFPTRRSLSEERSNREEEEEEEEGVLAFPTAIRSTVPPWAKRAHKPGPTAEEDARYTVSWQLCSKTHLLLISSVEARKLYQHFLGATVSSYS